MKMTLPYYSIAFYKEKGNPECLQHRNYNIEASDEKEAERIARAEFAEFRKDCNIVIENDKDCGFYVRINPYHYYIAKSIKREGEAFKDAARKVLSANCGDIPVIAKVEAKDKDDVCYICSKDPFKMGFTTIQRFYIKFDGKELYAIANDYHRDRFVKAMNKNHITYKEV